jgi:hypothetical protein
VISTPNKDEYVMSSGFHVREFSPQEFAQLLSQHFPIALLLYQQNWLMSALLHQEQLALDDEQKRLEIDLSKLAGLTPGGELYTVAICGEPLNEELRDVGVATSVYEAHKLAQRAEELDALHKVWVERAEEAERLVRAWNERAEEAERQLAEKIETLRRFESSLSWRITKPFRSVKQALRRIRE